MEGNRQALRKLTATACEVLEQMVVHSGDWDSRPRRERKGAADGGQVAGTEAGGTSKIWPRGQREGITRRGNSMTVAEV